MIESNSKLKFPVEADIYSMLENDSDNDDGNSVTVVGTADGVIHGLDSDGQTKRWSLSTGGSLINSHQSESETDYKMIPAVDGTILVHNREGMRKTSVKARMLVEKTPFVTPDGVIFTGKKTSRLLGVDISNGRVVHDSDPDDPSTASAAMHNLNHPHHPLGLRDSATKPLWLGRVDYTVRAFDEETGEEKFNMTYSEIIPLSSALGGGRSAGPGALRLPAGGRDSVYGGPTPLLSTPTGEIFFTDTSGRMHHSFDLSSPAVFAFNVQNDKDNGNGNKAVRAPSDFVIQPMTVHYRMALPSSSLSASSQHSASTALQETGTESVDSSGGRQGQEQPVAVVRSLVDGGLYAVVVPRFSEDTPAMGGDSDSDGDGVTDYSDSALLPAVAAMQHHQHQVAEKLAHSKGTGIGMGGTVIAPAMHTPSMSPLLSHLHPDNTEGRIIPPTTPAGSVAPVIEEAVVATVSSSSSLSSVVINDEHDDIDGSEVDSEEEEDLSVSLDTSSILGVHKILPTSTTTTTMSSSGGKDVSLPGSGDSNGNGGDGDGGSFRDPLQGIERMLLDELEDETEDHGGGGRRRPSSSPLSPALELAAKASGWIRFLESFLARILLGVGVVIMVVLFSRRTGVHIPLLTPLELIILRSLRMYPGELMTDELKLKNNAINVVGGGGSATTSSASESSTSSDHAAGSTSAVSLTTTADGQQRLTVGSLQLALSVVLGYGSHGTVVFRGSLNGRPVAIKRMLSQFHRAAEREISLLIRSDGHPNVVRYFLREQHGDFVYLALQLCRMSLRDFVVRLQHGMAAKRLRQSAAAGLGPRTVGNVLGRDGLLTSDHHLASHELTADELPDELRRALLQVAEGVAHLHSQHIVHRDLKPHNILLAAPDSELSTDGGASSDEPEVSSLKELGKYVLKISDMGLGKDLDGEGGSSTFNGPISMGCRDSMGKAGSSSGSDKERGSGAVGTVGWQAPELLLMRRSCETGLSSMMSSQSQGQEYDYAVSGKGSGKYFSKQTLDIFSLGCVFHYVIVPGGHPFGKWYEREANIMTARPDLSQLRGVPDALDLVSRMVENIPEKRPTAAQVCHHPFFWVAQKRLEFLVDFSDRLEHELPDSPLVLAVEGNAAAVVGRSWDRKLHRELLEDIGRYRKYDSASVRDCLRLIRNKRHHFNELAAPVKTIMSPLPTGFMLYFENRFPKLLMHCVSVCARFLDRDKDFAGFFRVIAPMFRMPPIIEGRESGASSTKSMTQIQFTTDSGKVMSSTYDNNNNNSEKSGLGSISRNNSTSDYNDNNISRIQSDSLKSTDTFTGSVTTNDKDRDRDRDETDDETETSSKRNVQIDGNDNNNSNSNNNNVDQQQRDNDPKTSVDQNATTTVVIQGTTDIASPSSAVSAPQDMADVMRLLDSGVTVWSGSALALTVGCTGWWREGDAWTPPSGPMPGQGTRGRGRPTHVTRASTDPKYRSRLCTHWEMTGGATCPMRKKGKCDFAHGPLELRVKEGRRGRWGQRTAPSPVATTGVSIPSTDGVVTDSSSSSPSIPVSASVSVSLHMSGGEDVLGAARSIEKVRVAEGSVSEFERSARKGAGGGGGSSSGPSSYSSPNKQQGSGSTKKKT
eukprot:gene2756-5426_t